jgi:hypothetical protein
MKTFTLTYHVKIVGRYLITGLLLVVLFQSEVMAQISSLYRGDKVRISAPNIYPETVRGTIYGINTTQITLNIEGDYYIFPLNSIERLDVSLGKKRHTGDGALIGLTGGALLGGLIGSTTYEPCNEDEERYGCSFHFSEKTSVQLGALAFGTIGLVVGTVIGAVIKTDVWKRYPLKASMDFQSVPTQKLSFSPVVSFEIFF